MEQKTKVVEMDNLCKTGVFITIFFSILIFLSGCLMLLYFAIFYNWIIILGNNFLLFFKLFYYGIIIFVMILQIVSFILSILLLKGKVTSPITVGVVSVIFSGIIGGILILVGKYKITYVQTTSTAPIVVPVAN